MLERIEAPDQSVVYRSPALTAIGVPHVFTSAVGPGGEPVDAGTPGPLDRILLERVGGAADASVIRVRQVHGTDLVRARGAWLGEDPAADGLWSEDSRCTLLVKTADCLPVLLARSDGRRVAAVHAGWRGLVAGILPRAVEAMEGGELVAALGPCISRNRFEVGAEVAAAFEAEGLGAAVHGPPPGSKSEKPHIDLRQAASLQLEAAGVRAIETSELCTWSENELHSYRRDVTHGGASSTGRMGALICARPIAP